MQIFDTRLKLVMVTLTIIWLTVTLGLFSFVMKPKRKSTCELYMVQMLSHFLFIAWALIPYHHIFDVDGFKAEVKQFAANFGGPNNEKAQCPEFDARHWNQFSKRNFSTVIILLIGMYLVYSKLFRNVHRSMESLYEHRRQAHMRENRHETDIGLAIYPATKKEKKVTFRLPEREVLKTSVYLNKIVEGCHFILPCKRQVIAAIICVVLSKSLFPKPAKLAFPIHFIQSDQFDFTSDHVFGAAMLMISIELSRIVSLSLYPSSGTCDFRLAVARFVQIYGIFLLLLSLIILLQTNDILKLYIYKVFIRCGNTNNWRSFFDVRVPNESLLSAILGENMMKYTNGILDEKSVSDNTTEKIEAAVDLFTWVFGDCVTVILFATLVCVPCALVCICGN